MPNISTSLNFGGTELSLIDHHGKPWLSAADLARALGYSRADAVSRIYERNSEEFTSEMSQTVNLTVWDSDGVERPRDTRIFSPRGCHLIAMFSKTPRAKTFRKWVLDILDGINLNHPPKTDTISNEQYRKLHNAIHCMAHNMQFSNSVQWNAWQCLRETYGVSAHDIPAEHFEDALAIIEQMNKQVEKFKSMVAEANKRFCKEVLRINGDIHEFEKRLKNLQWH